MAEARGQACNPTKLSARRTAAALFPITLNEGRSTGLNPVARVSIDLADSRRFAELSGDFNPIHLNPVEARRLIFGNTVPHGIHLLLLALDRALQDGWTNTAVRSLKATFAMPPIHRELIDILAEHEAAGVRLIARQNSTILQTITIQFGASAECSDPELENGLFEPEAADMLSLEAAGAAGGTLRLRLALDLATAMFPVLLRRLPHWQTALLLATTRIVGMKCPGLHSVFAALELNLAGAGPTAIDYAVRRTEPRLNLLGIDLSAEGSSGRVTALMRPPPTAQPSAAELRPLVREDEFTGRRILVIGGSRGLGELAAKIFGLGGAEVWLSYARGADEAHKVVAEIREFGGKADAFQLDITESEHRPLLGLCAGYRPTHVYFFATPPIRLVRGRSWNPQLFAAFCRFYVEGLAALMERIDSAPGDIEPLHLFYPSTVFIERPPPGAAEYVAAKAAGEALCRSLAASRAHLSIRCPRLPPLKTDQTSSLIAAAGKPADPVPILLTELRA